MTNTTTPDQSFKTDPADHTFVIETVERVILTPHPDDFTICGFTEDEAHVGTIIDVAILPEDDDEGFENEAAVGFYKLTFRGGPITVSYDGDNIVVDAEGMEVKYPAPFHGTLRVYSENAA